MNEAVVLVAHGTVEALDDLPEFLANIRRGHPAPPELVAEVRRRYEAIGGKSPLLDVTRDVAKKLETKLGMPVRTAMRLFRPYPREVLASLRAEQGVSKVYVVPLAQHSAHVYAEAVRKEADGVEVVAAGNWGRIPELTRAFADAIAPVLRDTGPEAVLLMTAHSLPKAVIEAGDPYEREVRGSAEDVAAELRRRGVPFAEMRVAFQSQGAGAKPGTWLGPDLRETLEDVARGASAGSGPAGSTPPGPRKKPVVVAPIGFLADHVEILYDLDIEAKAWCDALSIALYRSPSLNAGDALVEALAAVVAGLR